MILKIILLSILIYLCFKHNEPMKCNDLTLKEPPLASIYDVKENKNLVFEKEKAQYNKELKQYFKDINKYCLDK